VSGTFRHVSDDDSDEEDDGVEPVVAQDEGDDEEAHPEEDGDGCDLETPITNHLSNPVTLLSIIIAHLR